MAMNDTAFRNGVLALLPQLRRFCYALTGTATDGDDLLQSTVERALNKRHLFADGTDLKSWLFRMSRNMWIDDIRKRKTQSNAADALAASRPEWHADGLAAGEALLSLRDARSILESMPEEQRTIMLLVGVEGHSYRDAADILGIPVGTVMSRLARARARLADGLLTGDES